MPLYYYTPKTAFFRECLESKELKPGLGSFVFLSTNAASSGEILAQARVVVDDSVPVLDWDEWAKVATESVPQVARLARLAAKAGGNISYWRFSVKPIPAEKWLAVEALDPDDNWVPYDSVPPDPVFPDEMLLVRREADKLTGPQSISVRTAVSVLEQYFQHRHDAFGKRADEALGNLSLTFAAMSHDLVATRNERDQAQQVLQRIPGGILISHDDAARFADAIESGNQWVTDELVAVLRGDSL